MRREELSRAVPLELTSLGGDVLGPVHPVPQCRKGMSAIVDSASPIAPRSAQLGASGKRIGHGTGAGPPSPPKRGKGAMGWGFGFVITAGGGKQTPKPDQ